MAWGVCCCTRDRDASGAIFCCLTALPPTSCLQAAVQVCHSISAAAQHVAAAQAGGSVHVVPDLLAASLQRVVESHRLGVSEAPPPHGGDVGAMGSVPDAAGDAMAQAFELAAAKVGREDVPLVMSHGKPEPFVASLHILPHSAEEIRGTWIKVRHCSRQRCACSHQVLCWTVARTCDKCIDPDCATMIVMRAR